MSGDIKRPISHEEVKSEHKNGKVLVVLCGFSQNSYNTNKAEVVGCLNKFGCETIIFINYSSYKEELKKLTAGFDEKQKREAGSVFKEQKAIPVVNYIVRELKLANFDLMGISAGGGIAINVANNPAVKVNKLYLIAPAYNGGLLKIPKCPIVLSYDMGDKDVEFSEIKKIYIDLLLFSQYPCKIILTRVNSTVPEEIHRFQPSMFD